MTDDSLKIVVMSSMSSGNEAEWVGALPLIWHFRREGADASTPPEERIAGATNRSAEAALKAFDQETGRTLDGADSSLADEKTEPDSFTKAEQAIESSTR